MSPAALWSRRGLPLVLIIAATACSSRGAPPPASAAAPQVHPGATLLATVGIAEDPEAFEIALTMQDGQPVETLAAGRYTVVVQDLAQTHNFHLTGDGVDVSTDVAGRGRKIFDVTFQKGDYGYVCDPHPSMSGALRAV